MALKGVEGHVVHVPLGEPDEPYEKERAHISVSKRRRRTDWFPWSVLGYILCPLTGVCAIYYAVRANYAMDKTLEEALIDGVVYRAKGFTIFSVIFGIAILVAVIVIVATVLASSPGSLTQIVSLYKP